MPTARIRVTAELKHTLETMKLDPRETLKDVVERLLEDVRQLDMTTLADIERARAEFRAGKFLTQDQLRAKLNLC